MAYWRIQIYWIVSRKVNVRGSWFLGLFDEVRNTHKLNGSLLVRGTNLLLEGWPISYSHLSRVNNRLRSAPVLGFTATDVMEDTRVVWKLSFIDFWHFIFDYGAYVNHPLEIKVMMVMRKVKKDNTGWWKWAVPDSRIVCRVLSSMSFSRHPSLSLYGRQKWVTSVMFKWLHDFVFDCRWWLETKWSSTPWMPVSHSMPAHTSWWTIQDAMRFVWNSSSLLRCFCVSVFVCKGCS